MTDGYISVTQPLPAKSHSAKPSAKPCLRFRLQHSTALGSVAVQPPNYGRMEPQGAGLRVTAHLFNLGGVGPGTPLCTEGRLVYHGRLVT